MDGGGHPAHRVVEQEGQAVGGKYHQAEAGHVGHEAVGLIVLHPAEAQAVVGGGADAHHVAVDLAGENHMVRLRAHSGAEAAVILPDLLPVVPAIGAQVERGKDPLAHTAQPGGKAVGGSQFRDMGVGHAIDSRLYELHKLSFMNGYERNRE